MEEWRDTPHYNFNLARRDLTIPKNILLWEKETKVHMDMVVERLEEDIQNVKDMHDRHLKFVDELAAGLSASSGTASDTPKPPSGPHSGGGSGSPSK